MEEAMASLSEQERAVFDAPCHAYPTM